MGFLELIGRHLDAPEVAAFEAGMAVIRREFPVEDLTAFLERWSVSPHPDAS